MGQTTLTGDGRRVRVALNRGCVLVVGNGADVRVERNEGEVRVVGNGGRVRVLSNAERGCVRYVGDGGCVRVGGGAGQVDYAGSGGPRGSPRGGGRGALRLPLPLPLPRPFALASPAAAAPLVRVSHRPHARAAFREVPLRANAPATAITVNVASAADAQRWTAKFARGLWIAT